MNKRAEAAEVLFDPAEHLPEGIGEIRNHQTDLPRIAKDKELIAAIEAKLEQLPTHHDLYQRDCRKIDFLPPDSVHLVVTSPPYWTLKDYNVSEGQMGYIEHFFTEFQQPQGKDEKVFQTTTHQILAVADKLSISLGKETKALRSRSYILSVYLFFYELVADGDLTAAEQKKFADFVFKLVKRLRDESRLGIDRKNRELYSFDTMLSSAPGEKYQIERRHEKLGEYYDYFKKTGKIKGD